MSSRDRVVEPWGVRLVPAAGLLFLVGCLVRGAYVLPSAETAESFARWTTRPLFLVGYLILIAAATTSLFGYRALAARLATRGARVAMVTATVGVAFLLALFGAAVVVQAALGRAHLAGDAGAIEIAASTFSTGPLVVIGAMTVWNVVGHVVFAVGVWRTPGLPKLGALLFVLGPIGMLMPFFYPVELLGCAFYLLGGGLLAGALGRRAG
jgi:hypothetical protein